jgi:hypothetical protein
VPWWQNGKGNKARGCPRADNELIKRGFASEKKDEGKSRKMIDEKEL